MVGIATWTIEKSMKSRNVAAMTRARMIRVCGANPACGGDFSVCSVPAVTCSTPSVSVGRKAFAIRRIRFVQGGERRYSPPEHFQGRCWLECGGVRHQAESSRHHFPCGWYRRMTPPDFRGLASRSFNFIPAESVLNNGAPPPRTTGARQMSYSSIRPARESDAVSFALPKMKMFLPGCCFSLATSFSASPFTSLVLFQSAFFSVLEKTTLGTRFMKSAILSFAEGQYDAMPSYVARPKRSVSVDFDCSREYSSSSSPQTES